MEELDRIDWDNFRMNVVSSLNKKQFDLVCTLHAKYFKHPFRRPCTCSPKTIKMWIAQLNDIYDKDTKDK